MVNIQRVFGCGIDSRKFKTKYESLSEENRLRLGRVARRVRLTLKLHYQVSIYASPFERYSEEEFNLTYVEFPSTEIYLLCTCLDTLAGQANYQSFPDWLKTQSKKSLSLEEISDLYVHYQEEYGIRRNLKKLFSNLPQSAKLWLSNNVRIKDFGKPLTTSDQNIDTLINRLFVYFFDVTRNAFTHGSVTRHTVQADKIQASNDSNWWVTPAQGIFVPDRKRPDKEFIFSYRQGLDEATILRVIIHAVALQFLNIELTPELITANLQKYSRLDALYAFIAEVNNNSVATNVWSKLSEVKTLSDLKRSNYYESFPLRVKFPLLRSEAATNIVDMYLDNPLESGFKQMTLQYLNEIKHINSIISDFNNSNPPPEDNDHESERWQVVKAFLKEQTQKPFLDAMMKWPTRITNLWLIIRDPCYT